MERLRQFEIFYRKAGTDLAMARFLVPTVSVGIQTMTVCQNRHSLAGAWERGKDGVVDIEPKIVYKYCKIHNQSQGG